MLQTHVNNDIYNKYCLIHNTGISKSANFASCRDCLPYLASAETVHVIVLPVESLGRKQNYADRFGRMPFLHVHVQQSLREPNASLGEGHLIIGLNRLRFFLSETTGSGCIAGRSFNSTILCLQKISKSMSKTNVQKVHIA